MSVTKQHVKTYLFFHLYTNINEELIILIAHLHTCLHSEYMYFLKYINANWYFHTTVAECLDGFYNTQCSGVCGSCVNGDVCEKIGGHCVNGCMENYQGPLCRGKI